MPEDWGDGVYEHTAAELEPAAEHVIELLDPAPGDRVLDVACGTGNAALLAAARGARVTGADITPRLVDVARERAAAAGLDAQWAVADATTLPYADAAFDAAVSIFGVIFAQPAAAAAAELLRVVRPGGRILVTSWPRAGVMFAAATLLRAAIAAAAPPAADAPPPTDWSDPATIGTLFAGAAAITISDADLVLTGASADEVADGLFEYHPSWRSARRVLATAEFAELRAATVRTLAAGSEDPPAFKATSPYRVIAMTR